VAPQGDAFANLPVRNLLMYSKGKPTKSRALVYQDATEAAKGTSTDAFPGFEAIGIDDFEDLRDEVTHGLLQRKRIFVEDAAVGSYRTSEIRVRVISDRPEASLFFRNMLLPTPLYSADCFPRNIVVIDASMHGTGFDGKGAPQEKPTIATDIDPDAPTSAKATVVVRGRVPLTQIMEHVVHAASQLAVLGGYRHLDGAPPAASQLAALGEVVDRSRYALASPAEPHPSLLVLPGDVVYGANGSTAALLGASGALAASMMAPSALVGAREGPDLAMRSLAVTTTGPFAAHHFVWDSERVSRVWGGLVASGSAIPAPDALPRGALHLGSSIVSGFLTPKTASPPKKLMIVAPSKKDGVEAVGADKFIDLAAVQFRLSEKEASLLKDRIASTKPDLALVSSVKAAKAALKA
jgi:hypothetical protein